MTEEKIEEKIEVKEKPKAKRKPRVSKEPEFKFKFTDKEVEEFKKWKEENEKKCQMTCDAPDDDKVYRLWKEESKLVKGIFRCHEPPGGSVKFAFKKYKWDQLQWYTMYDGEIYEVPLAVARHLNSNCGYPIHSHILDAKGNPTIDKTGKVKSRMNFESTEFALA